jgi:sialate O-acetylesterase
MLTRFALVANLFLACGAEQSFTDPASVPLLTGHTASFVLTTAGDLVLGGGASVASAPLTSIRSGSPGQHSTAVISVPLMPGTTLTGLSVAYRYDTGFGKAGDGKVGSNFTVLAGGTPLYRSPHLVDFSYDEDRSNYSAPIAVDAAGLSIPVGHGAKTHIEFAFDSNDRNVQLLLPLVVNITCTGGPCASVFKLSATLQDSMVLQRAPAAAVVWGFAVPGTTVTTAFGGKTITSTADSTSVWRAKLPPTAASATPQTISFAASTGESAVLKDVLFGDVYLCGGQSNMQFSLGANENAAAYRKEANKYPDIRLFTVGQGTKSSAPLQDLLTIEQNWAAASNTTVSDGSKFNYFSAVCWFFGKNVYDGLGGKVPIGLVNNNWGGTRVEQWTPPQSTAQCGHASTGELYNAMIHPYTIGPMALSGFTWYQGESDLGGRPYLPDQNNNYTCTQTAMIQQWRADFGAPDAFYAIVQLSTWFTNPHLLAELRDQQLASAAALGKGFAYGTNADYGAGGNIHPPYKQHVGQRLANAALAIVYGHKINWRSPTYASATAATNTVNAAAAATTSITVSLNDVEGGLVLKDAFNRGTAGDCTAQNAKTPDSCAWASIQFDDAARSWVNATVGLSANKKAIVLGASAPAGATKAVATSYGWGSVPMMTVYRVDMEGEDGQLPVLAWNETL